MKKILNYIANGQGMAMKIMLIVALASAIFLSALIKFGGNQLVPMMQEVADQALPIKIENGVVVEPINTLKVINLIPMYENISMPFVIDTREDKLDTTELKNGLYMSRTAVYSIANGQTRINQFSGNMNLPAGDYTNSFRAMLTWVAVASGVLGFVLFFVLIFGLSLFYAGCSYLSSAVMRKNYNFDLRVRLSVLALLTTYIFYKITLLVDFSANNLLFFVTVLLIQALAMREIPSQEKPKNIEIKN